MNIFKTFKQCILPIKQHFYLIKRSTITEIKQRYAGSILGLFWVLLYPIFLFTIYSVLYIFVFRIKPENMTSHAYLVYMMSGLFPFLGFSESLNTGTVSLSTKKSLLLNTIYPSEFIPLQVVLSSNIILFVGIILLILSDLLILKTFYWTILIVPYLVLLQLMFSVGIAWVLSIINLVIRDVQQILSFITMTLMFISPIAFTPEMVPSQLKLIMYLNPFSYFVWCYQDIFTKGVINSNLMIATLISIVTFTAGNLFYTKSKKVFYEFA